MSCKIHLIAAARPNFMKVAPLYHALAAQSWCTTRIVHTGQHYDANMSDAFFRDLRLPAPHFHLEVGSGSHGQQTAGVMVAYEKVCEQDRPDWTVVVGDVNSTAACAMVAAKMWISVVHLEAGLRSRDRRMPEEINRLVTDAISDVLWTPSPDADENLLREGVPAERIDRVGNIMIDSYEMMRPQIEADAGPSKFGLQPGGYAVVTLHRPSNVDDERTLGNLMQQMQAISARLPLLFAVHPRTRKKLEEFRLWAGLQAAPGIRLTEPLGYVEFMALVKGARAVVTDSGGVQEESTYLGIPCLTLRENTERPITVTQGTNRLVAAGELLQSLDVVLAGRWPTGSRPDRWDGQAAQRCVAALKRRHEGKRLS
ncbi:MAG TPA: UDP-N-acetylglucosamine 2-epimerase (non-hydrolyzing) [Steroidobacteraceae bacterium]|nr:UDP-N-acetylglucosamine 2-epimerase (non-hydrolyzing) [Steroidobacteraceae bacterium]